MKKAFFLALFLLGFISLWAQESGQILYFTEGVQFVNERVIVNNGDTTSYYYTYEIAARVDSFINDDDNVEYEDAYCCKYYTSSVSYEGNDSIICRISPKYTVGGSFWVYDNEAYKKIRTEGRNLTQELGLMVPMHLYDLLYSYETLFSSAVWRYVLIQPEPRALKEENFVEIDPVLIDGKEVQRIAYISDDGEPLAYIVAGIGFDSYDMGDLLTPFTRQPDHDADYQEWCGLSHVVKDGKIIYKGMRYRHGAFTGIDEVVAKLPACPIDPNYYNLMGQPVGTEVPTTPGIYIHQGKKIIVR